MTFDEFQTLLEKVELGISPQEMRFVISEADENENGVVDYCEFVPLASCSFILFISFIHRLSF